MIASPVGTPSALAAKAATTTIPIVFGVNEDPVKLGLVATLARPGGNATGINILSGELAAKRLELLRELVPSAARVAVLVNPTNAATTETTLRDVEGLLAPSACKSRSSTPAPAVRSMRLSQPLCATADALFVGADPFFTSRRVQLANLASHHSIPAHGARAICRSRRADELRQRHCGCLSADGCLQRPRPQGSQASRPAGGAVDEV